MTTYTPTLTVAFVVKLVAKEEKADELGAFLGGALSLANDEAGTIVWFALRTDVTTFWIVDAFGIHEGCELLSCIAAGVQLGEILLLRQGKSIKELCS